MRNPNVAHFREVDKAIETGCAPFHIQEPSLIGRQTRCARNGRGRRLYALPVLKFCSAGSNVGNSRGGSILLSVHSNRSRVNLDLDHFVLQYVVDQINPSRRSSFVRRRELRTFERE
jgi:hypothetical protein